MSQPVVPRQFHEVAEADWAPDMPLVGREIECRNGKARIFDCRDVDLLAFLPESVLGGPTLTALSGWTDTATGREFVLAAREGGTSFIEITDPLNPRYLGALPLHQGARPSRQRDLEVYKNHAFIVSDVDDHGMQVFDLTQLLEVTGAPMIFQETAHYDGIGASHTIALDAATGFAYVTRGQKHCGGLIEMIDVRDPPRPAFAGCSVERAHEEQCAVYHGPDQRYRGRELCFLASIPKVHVVDVTDKQHAQLISSVSYPTAVGTHQGWLSEDHHYFFLGDEGDELNRKAMTRTIVFDLTDLNDLVVVKEFFGTTPATDHNMYVRGRYIYQANYRAGLRVLDISDPVNPKEVGYFDTTPAEETTSAMLGGSWDSYPYFKNGVIAVSTYGLKDVSVGKGLFVLRYRPATATTP